MNEATITGFFDEMSKIAEEDEFTVVPGSWWTGMKAQRRAETGRSAKRGGGLFVDPHLQMAASKGALKGMGAGGGIGLGAGALLGGGVGLLSKGRFGTTPHLMGAGAGLGGLAGAAIGGGVGESQAVDKWMKRKGVKSRIGGLGRPHLTPEAAKRYLTREELAEATTRE